jgi:hypothetical protein
MSKKIEIVPVFDPHELKQKLEKMVNEGWEIKGVIGENVNSGPLVILEHLSYEETMKEEFHSEIKEPLAEQFYVRSSPPQKEISISIGGD